MRYTIKKGNHYHSNWLQHLLFFRWGKEMTRTVKFDRSCWYEECKVEDSGWNKLWGYGGLFHHSNSARWAWRPDHNNEGIIRIASYCYVNGERQIFEVFSIHTDIEFTLTINQTPDVYLFSHDIITHSVIAKGRKPRWKRLGPYFGGKDFAYRNFIIDIKNR